VEQTTQLIQQQPLDTEAIYIILKNSINTSKKTQRFPTTQVTLLTLFQEVFALYSKNRTKPIHIDSAGKMLSF
jgi:hypothetical protein